MENYRVLQSLMNHYSNLVEERKLYEKAVIEYYNEVANNEGWGWIEKEQVKNKIFNKYGVEESKVSTRTEIKNLGMIIRKLMIKVEGEIKSRWDI